MKYHREQREGTVYFLVKTNKTLKLEPAKDKDAYPWAGAAQGGAFGATGIAGTNITMAQFAARLSQALAGPVIDKTGLEDPFEFRFDYATEGESSDHTTAILMSVQRLGLKLQSGKGPVETMVIDRAEERVEN